MSDEIKFKCEECGKEFDPNPDTMIEMIISEDACEEVEIDDEESNEPYKNYPVEEINLSLQEMDALSRGEEVPVGGMCICIECQDKLEKEQEL